MFKFKKSTKLVGDIDIMDKNRCIFLLKKGSRDSIPEFAHFEKLWIGEESSESFGFPIRSVTGFIKDNKFCVTTSSVRVFRNEIEYMDYLRVRLILLTSENYVNDSYMNDWSKLPKYHLHGNEGFKELSLPISPVGGVTRDIKTIKILPNYGSKISP